MLGSKIESRTIYSAGLVALILSSLLQLFARHYPDVHPDLMDGLRGLCLGIFMGAMALKVWRNGRRVS